MAETILLVRHGEAESNAGKYFGGWLDVPLTRLGKQQASALSRRLSKEPIGRTFCSDMLRTRGTLEHLSLSCPAEYSKELREKSYGELEGMRWDEDARLEKYHLDAYARAPGGENCADVQKRVMEYFGRKVFPSREETVLVVSHHGPIVLFACKMLGVPLHNWRMLRLGNCGLSIFSLEGKMWRMRLWNSLSHHGLQSFQPLLGKEKKKG